MAETLKYNVGDIVELGTIKYHAQFKKGDVVKIINRRKSYMDYKATLLSDASDFWWIKDDEIKGLVNNKTQTIKTETMSTIQTKADQLKKDAVKEVANELLLANNTVTTLEIKTELIVKYPAFNWKQKFISETMDEFYRNGEFDYTDNGTFRVYSALPTSGTVAASPAITVSVSNGSVTVANGVISKADLTTIPKKARKSKKGASKYTNDELRDMMKNNKGHFFTATFISKKGERTINCQYISGQTPKQGQENYVLVKEAIKMKKDPNDAIRQINLDTLKSLKIAGKVITK